MHRATSTEDGCQLWIVVLFSRGCCLSFHRLPASLATNTTWHFRRFRSKYLPSEKPRLYADHGVIVVCEPSNRSARTSNYLWDGLLQRPKTDIHCQFLVSGRIRTALRVKMSCLRRVFWCTHNEHFRGASDKAPRFWSLLLTEVS